MASSFCRQGWPGISGGRASCPEPRNAGFGFGPAVATARGTPMITGGATATPCCGGRRIGELAALCSGSGCTAGAAGVVGTDSSLPPLAPPSHGAAADTAETEDSRGCHDSKENPAPLYVLPDGLALRQFWPDLEDAVGSDLQQLRVLHVALGKSGTAKGGAGVLQLHGQAIGSSAEGSGGREIWTTENHLHAPGLEGKQAGHSHALP
eukprot:CAMPEP_0175308948 /NCGR_PEP_ID=MMETSP0093-20121207/65552_1 /TAXON_ID=311494 /ORGANISM="Alexandrium monilatum, Strain CCMP3105" /LENGTH=207 /DNA_ID=CAMNT_0016605481 /DNA_START=77 /DNA_END=696 /DNA_ORIENTATION=-